MTARRVRLDVIPSFLNPRVEDAMARRVQGEERRDSRSGVGLKGGAMKKIFVITGRIKVVNFFFFLCKGVGKGGGG